MIFESPVPIWLIVGIIFIGLPVLLAVAFFLSRLFMPGSGCLTLALFLVGILAVGLTLTTYLNHAGDTVIGEVLDKRESLLYHRDGSWNREMSADIKYSLTDGAAPITESLSLLQSRFDDMHQGDFVRLRIADIFGQFRFVRLEDQSIASLVWRLAGEQPFFFLLGAGLFLVVAARSIRNASFPVLFFLTGLVTVGSWWISTVALPLWEQATIRMSSINTVSGVVREIHQPYLGDDLRARVSTELFAPYEIVLVDMTPLTQSQPLLAIDVVDDGSAKVQAGQSINVEYSAGNPRFAILPDATRSYVWKNGLMGTLLAGIALVAIILFAVWLARHFGDPAEIPAPRRSRSHRGTAA